MSPAFSWQWYDVQPLLAAAVYRLLSQSMEIEGGLSALRYDLRAKICKKLIHPSGQCIRGLAVALRQ